MKSPIDLRSYRTPDDWFSLLEGYKIALQQKGASHAEMDLRGKDQKSMRELRQAALFAYAYREALSISDLKVCPNLEEDSDADAALQWTKDGQIHEMPVQLKELPPAERNVDVRVEDLLRKAVTKYHTGTDLILAIFLNRHQYFGKVKVPHLRVCEVWFWGFSKPDHSEMMLAGGKTGQSANYRISFGPAR